MKMIMLILFFIFFSASGQLFLRAGAKAHEQIFTSNIMNIQFWSSLLQNKFIITGLGMWILATSSWLLVLRATQLSFAYCLTSLNYIIIPLAAWYLFRESLSITRIVGMMIILIGVIITIYGRYGEVIGN